MAHDQTISKIAHLLKGESSYWINKTNLIVNDFRKEKFDWQDEYFVESVSPQDLPSVLIYISTQEVNHLHFTFQEEYEKFINEFKKEILP
jgi:REP element-mobilizing transposase RayT